MIFTNVIKNAARIAGPIATYFGKQRRDSRYIVTTIFSALIVGITTLQAVNSGWFDSVERPIFEAVNDLPSYFGPIMYVITQFGGLGGLLFWCGIAWYLINRRAALTVFGGGASAWFIAKILKSLVARGRPGDLLQSVHLFGTEHFAGYGFPSGHSAFSAACATVLYYQVDRKYRKYLLIIVALVGFSRMYLGAHFPLDVVGGWALGVLIGSLTNIIFGLSIKSISAARLKSILRQKGYDAQSLEYANVDARGSRPVFFTDAKGRQYFGKLFGASEQAADWLFKIYRFFRYKNLHGEEPYFSGRRNIEIESFATLWAERHGVRAPQIIDVLQVGQSWMLIQERLDARPLSDYKRPRQASLVDAWEQVKTLHEANMAHRDLRAANLMIDNHGKAWVIDFGFAEVAPRRSRQLMDIAELMLSMALVVGPKRTADAALGVLDHDRIAAAMPYMRREALSNATAKALKANKSCLQTLKEYLSEQLGIDTEVKEIDIVRFSRRKILTIGVIAAVLYVALPQFNQFKGTLQALSDVDVAWLPLVVGASIMTYVFTGLIYIFLADVPLRLWRTTYVKLAASFMSKIVPGGVGSAGLNARYLSKAGMSAPEITAVMAGQGIIGVVTFVVPLLLFLLLTGNSLSSLLTFHATQREVLIVLAVVLVVAAILRFIAALRQRVIAFLKEFVQNVRTLMSAPREVAWAAAASLAVTLAYIFCLYASMQAFGIHAGITVAVLVYVSATIARTVVPTPGGLGPLEIAMVSSMVGFGIVKPEAIAVVVLYRLATYWLPIPFSALAYRYLVRKRVI